MDYRGIQRAFWQSFEAGTGVRQIRLPSVFALGRPDSLLGCTVKLTSRPRVGVAADSAGGPHFGVTAAEAAMNLASV